MSKISDVTNFKKFLPLHDRVLVKRLENEGKSAGGIILPDSVQEKPMVARVEAIGSGTRDSNSKIIPLDVKVGDLVLLGKWGGTEVKLGGQEYLVIKESEILGIVETA